MRADGESYLVTGATGYIGSMLVKYISTMDQTAQITVLVRNQGKAEQMLPTGVQIFRTDLSDREIIKKLDIPCDYLIHCASITSSARMASQPVEVTESIVNTTQNILEFTRRRKIKSMVYLSSMEVYGRMDCKESHPAQESEAGLGEVEILKARSCYPLGKRLAENICYSYYMEYGIPVKIARLAQTFGKGVLPLENRVFAQFARAVKTRTDIVLHTDGNSMGNYCGIEDTLKGILTILQRGTDGEAYNVVNENNTMTIRQMAQLAAEKIAGGKIRVVCDIPEDDRYGYAAKTGLRLSGKKLEALGWNPQESLEGMYLDLMKEL